MPKWKAAPPLTKTARHLIWLQGLLDFAEGKPRQSQGPIYCEGYGAARPGGYVTLQNGKVLTAIEQLKREIIDCKAGYPLHRAAREQQQKAMTSDVRARR